MIRIGSKIKIISENQYYDKYRHLTLKIHNWTNNINNRAYDSALYPMKLCDIETLDGKILPFSLYEWEFKKV